MNMTISNKIKLAIKSETTQSTVISVDHVSIGSDEIVIMAGPCSVESQEQILTIAHAVKKIGGHVLRGGAFKPRTLPYSFQGLGEEGLKLLSIAKEETGLPYVTEVLAPEEVSLVEKYADILQIGARNMQNYPLLKRVGKVSKPILLKRGMSATIEEWLGCAEYILNEGNPNVILCERGIRTFEKVTRNTLDISAVPIIKELSHLPIVIDPSHGTGIRSLVNPLSKASIAAGADGLIVEVHHNPEMALSDGAQSILPEDFRILIEELRPIANAVGRRIK
jgi:3-deoxy-7-phosphoheptulonate synthase